jgi:hypothetical protein
MEPVDHITAGQPASRKPHDGFTVVDDLAGLPVTDAELDAIEAFLMAQFKAVMAGETLAKAAVSATKDSEQPQTHAGIARSRAKRGARR